MKITSIWAMIGVAEPGSIFCYDMLSYAEHQLEMRSCRESHQNLTRYATSATDKMATTIAELQVTLRQSISALEQVNNQSITAVREISEGFREIATKMVDSNDKAIDLMSTLVNFVIMETGDVDNELDVLVQNKTLVAGAVIDGKLSAEERREKQLDFLITEYSVQADEVNEQLREAENDATESAVTRVIREYSVDHQLPRVNLTAVDVRRHHAKHVRGEIDDHIPVKVTDQTGNEIVMVRPTASRHRRATDGVVEPELAEPYSYKLFADGSFAVTVNGVDITEQMERNARGFFTTIDVVLPIDKARVEKKKDELIQLYLDGSSMSEVHGKWARWRDELRHEALTALESMPMPFDYRATYQYMERLVHGELKFPEEGTRHVGKGLGAIDIILIVIGCLIFCVIIGSIFQLDRKRFPGCTLSAGGNELPTPGSPQ